MKKLIIRELDAIEGETYYAGTYGEKAFEMTVYTADGCEFLFTKGDLTKEDKEDIMTQYYYDNYDEDGYEEEEQEALYEMSN